ncbi:MAG: uroporphyrinogen decarboxylase family protein, partial [Planctomycetota bacterium]
QGLAEDAKLAEVFQYDPPAAHGLGQLGWCEAAFRPAFEEKVIELRGDHELVQDHAGRHVLFFKGRRNGFMPEYVDHPVKDMATWTENVKWRLDPASPERFANLDERMSRATTAAAEGKMIVQGLIGPYMYPRSLIGPADLMYAWYDMPDVIRDCMDTWLALADPIIARHQEHVTIDELFLAEDSSYNHGLLASPETFREFMFPYIQQLVSNLRSRQIDGDRKLFIHIDTDGLCVPSIPLYGELGANVMSPFEVASGCDVIEIGREWPGLVIKGGIDKRVLAGTKSDIDAMVERIFPAMRERGGYVPTCDHGVPAEVPLENYVHYRKRAVELGG